MNKQKWLILTGGIMLAFGLMLALFASHYNSKVMGEAALGVGVWAPNENSPEWKRKEGLRRKSDYCFNFGILLTFAGISIQTIGSLIKEQV